MSEKGLKEKEYILKKGYLNVPT